MLGREWWTMRSCGPRCGDVPGIRLSQNLWGLSLHARGCLGALCGDGQPQAMTKESLVGPEGVFQMLKTESSPCVVDLSTFIQ